jgi:hypothetical protein
MNNFVALLDLACGRASRSEDQGRARTLQLIIAALLLSLAFVGIWGLAAGSQSAGLALSNLYKVPMVTLLSALAAIPPGLLAFKLCGASGRSSDLLLDFATGVFAGSLVLAVVSPLVALYYHSSVWAGPLLGMGSAFAGIGVGSLIFLRGAFQKRQGVVLRRRTLVLPVGIFLAMQLATMVQLIALASPILPEQTVFDRGIDQMVKR